MFHFKIEVEGASIRILHIIRALGRGGAEQQLVNIISNTRRAEFEHLVCHFTRPNDRAEEIHDAGWPTVELGVASKYGWLQAAARLRPIIKDFGPDNIHNWMFDGALCSRLASLYGNNIPLIASIQNVDYEADTIRNAQLSPVKVRAAQHIDKLSGRLTNSFFVPCSNFVKESSVKYLGIPESRTRVIYNSVNPDALECEPGAAERLRNELGLPPDLVLRLKLRQKLQS